MGIKGARDNRTVASRGRILVTGATGYIGGRVTSALLANGWETHATTRVTSRNLPAGVIHHTIDESYASVDAAVALARPALTVHMASRVLVTHNSDDIAELIKANIQFPTFLLEAMNRYGVKKFIDTGTSWQHFDPDAEYSPTNLYAATKQSFSDICQYYVDALAFTTIQLKLFDVYGPQDNRGKIIPLLMRLIKTGDSLAMSGGAQRMDMIFINDVIDAFIKAIARLTAGQASGFERYAIRSGDVFTLREIVDEFQRQANKSLNIQWGGRPYRDREVMEPWHSSGTCLPGWLAQTKLTEGLRQVILAG